MEYLESQSAPFLTVTSLEEVAGDDVNDVDIDRTFFHFFIRALRKLYKNGP